MTDTLLPEVLVQPSSGVRRPLMMVDDAHVNYQVYASGKRVGAQEANRLSLSALRGGRDLKVVSALRGVTFTAYEGESIGVVGHNGSGKSTLFKAMTGLIPTSQGAIWARDRPVLLGVNAALVPELSGENNIKLGLLAMGYTTEEAAAEVDAIADFAELNEFISHPMKTYSSGMAARLRFAIASARAHSILLIDEALAVGDRRFKAKSEGRIRELRDSAGLVMIVSHSAGSLRSSCERVLWIHKGELIADGPSAEVIDDYVAWTKQSGSGAVGAAAMARGNAGKLPSTRHPVLSASEPAEAVAPTAAIGTAERPLQTGPVPLENQRTIERRERYRKAQKRRKRNRLITTVATGAAVVLAVAAGAWIGAIVQIPDPPAVIPSQPVEPASEAPVVELFSASAAVVVCATTEEEVPVQLNWQVDNATLVALATGSAEVDAIDQPLQSQLPLVAEAHAVPFPCAEETRTYTLTAAGADGTRSSATVIVARELTPVEEPEPEPGPITPVRPAPVAPVPAPQETTEPEQQPPQPVETSEAPQPDPTQTAAPEPTATTDPNSPEEETP